MAGLEFEPEHLSIADPSTRAELLLLSPSFRVPCLTHDGVSVWDTLAIAEYLNELMPSARLLPPEREARALCRSICGEMHAGFNNLRAALPMNLKAQYSDFKIWPGAQADIDRIVAIWTDCFDRYKGPFLFGDVSMADAMYAPVVTRFLTYNVPLDARCADYCRQILALPDMIEWREAAQREPDELEELDAEF